MHCLSIKWKSNLSDKIKWKFELHSRYYIHFLTLRKGMNPLSPFRVPLLFFKDGFGIKYPRKLICY